MRTLVLTDEQTWLLEEALLKLRRSYSSKARYHREEAAWKTRTASEGPADVERVAVLAAEAQAHGHYEREFSRRSDLLGELRRLIRTKVDPNQVHLGDRVMARLHAGEWLRVNDLTGQPLAAIVPPQLEQVLAAAVRSIGGEEATSHAA